MRQPRTAAPKFAALVEKATEPGTGMLAAGDTPRTAEAKSVHELLTCEHGSSTVCVCVMQRLEKMVYSPEYVMTGEAFEEWMRSGSEPTPALRDLMKDSKHRTSEAFIQIPALPINEGDQRIVDDLMRANRPAVTRPLRPNEASVEPLVRARIECRRAFDAESALGMLTHLERANAMLGGLRTDNPRKEHPEARAIRIMTAHFEELGNEECSECGYALNEIRDYVHELLALRKVAETALLLTRAMHAANVSGEMRACAEAIAEAKKARELSKHEVVIRTETPEKPR